MRTILTILIVALSLSLVSGQQCLNGAGEKVDWWVLLAFPNSVSTGYAYFDSTFTQANFTIDLNQPDAYGTPLRNTLTQINTLGMQSIAWNDETPDNKTSSTKAHSKSVASYDGATMLGFLFDHSIPKYPAFIGQQINATIPTSQQIYGQHCLCLSLTTDTINIMISKTLPITPFYYANTLSDPNAITNLINSGAISQPDYISLYTTMDYTIGNTDSKFIFKSGKINGSIFQDGINNMLQSRLVAETWGRPIQAPWCGRFEVGNVVTVQLTTSIGWKETQDHSKWCYALDQPYTCFGDMNRMTSQWKRGGSFYCLKSQILNQAIRNIVSQTSTCS